MSRRTAPRLDAGGRHGRASRFFAVGGRRAVAEAVRAGRARKVLAVRGSRRTQGLRALLLEAESSGLTIEWTDHQGLDQLGLADHQGVAALVTPPGELDERDLHSRAFDRDALVVVLDGITDPQNLGACARSAEAAAAALMVVRKRRAAPSTPAAVRASAGALLHLPVARVPNLPRVVEHLKDRGFFVMGLDHRAPTDLYGPAPPPGPLALVVGSEGTGISRLVRESCDQLVSIPMFGKTSSLNAAAALAVALFGYVRRPRA